MKSSRNPPLQVSILSKDAQALADHLSSIGDIRHLVDIVHVTDNPQRIVPSEVKILLAAPNLAVEMIGECHNLVWCQSSWAGNRPLLNHRKQDYLLTGIKDVFGPLMREYVFAYLLYHARSVNAFAANQAATPPIWEATARAPLHGKTLGILGLGNIGRALIPAAKAFGMKVIGVTNSGAPIDGADHIYTKTSLLDFARHADHIVNLMPDTPDTQNLLSTLFFSALKPNTVFINAGRGEAIDDEALLQSLACGKPALAVLDVFKEEPLPLDHSFWSHPNVIVTAHTAAESSPQDVANIFAENITRFVQQQPLLHTFDFKKGY